MYVCRNILMMVHLNRQTEKQTRKADVTISMHFSFCGSRNTRKGQRKNGARTGASWSSRPIHPMYCRPESRSISSKSSCCLHLMHWWRWHPPGWPLEASVALAVMATCEREGREGREGERGGQRGRCMQAHLSSRVCSINNIYTHVQRAFPLSPPSPNSPPPADLVPLRVRLPPLGVLLLVC